ncbi:BTAD domain-containing putative transcriptional regulator [Amycolatopsis sp. cg5]|uniref:AfsR/SARP family transcriptional regulator n=1 Tax=Amycolatopsis sp. cg5 TaxID=3238802 RepID=UPI0035231FB8
MEVRDEGKSVGLGGPKPKALLAALLQQSRQVVSIERLITLIWDETPPQSATALVHNYVSLLRRSFASAGRDGLLATRAPGYLLNLTPDESDIELFERYLDGARQAERERDFAAAATEYERALGLWRGPAFGGVDARFARQHAAGLDENRLDAEEGLGRCLLATRRSEEVASRLSRLVADHPLREEARGLLMRALYECGRQTEALGVYREGRQLLLDELGVEPGEKLRELHTRILTGDLERPKSPDRTPEKPPRHAVVPRQLPPDIADFTGRAEQVEAVLRSALASTDRMATPVVVVSGFGGAGKSALAVHVAHLLCDSYRDGQLFADLRGSDRDLGAGEVLRRFLGALGVTAADLPETLDERVELYRRKVSGRRLVIVLDNARGEHQVRSLLPGDPRCLVIVTSRSRLTGLEGAEPVELGFLGDEVAVEMLGKIIGTERAHADPEAARTIVRLCGGIPLALRAAAAKLQARPHWPLSALAGRLSNERRRLDELAVGDLAIRSSLRLNYAELDELQRRAFHLLTLLDLPDFDSWLAAPLLEISLDDAEDIVEQLVDLRLLEVVGVGPLGRVRYRFHDLVQLFGAEHATEAEPEEAVTAAVTRTLLSWMALVEVAAKKLPRVTLGLRPRLDIAVDVDARLIEHAERNPTEWFVSETGAVVRTLERAHDLGIDEVTTTLVTSLLSSPFAARNEFGGWQRINEVALAAARQSGRAQAEAVVLAGLGQLFYEKDDFTAALANFEQAARLAETVEDDATLAVAFVGMGTVRRDRADFGQAAKDLANAVEIAERIGDSQVLAAAGYGLGAICSEHGDFEPAVDYFSACVELYRELGDKRGEALARRGLSLCFRARDEPARAVELSRAAEALLLEAGDDLGAMYARQSLAKASIRDGITEGVAELLDSCLRGCGRHGDRFGVALMTRTAGELALATGDLARACELLGDALGKWTELGLPLWQARTLRDLAAAESVSQPALADEHWLAAMELFTAAEAREVAELAGYSPLTWHDRVRAAHL